LKPEIFAKAQRMADAANARPPASLLVKPAAVLRISSARLKAKTSKKIATLEVAFFWITDLEI
jgi:hypothetical protein